LGPRDAGRPIDLDTTLLVRLQHQSAISTGKPNDHRPARHNHAASHPERCVIAHPFNPPHLIPLVEIVGGAKTSEATIRRAADDGREAAKAADFNEDRKILGEPHVFHLCILCTVVSAEQPLNRLWPVA
jgi:hypothetical protein